MFGMVLLWSKFINLIHAFSTVVAYFFRVYLDGKLHGEVVANSNCNKNGYQYYLTDLKPGQSYEVSIKVSELTYRLLSQLLPTLLPLMSSR